MMVMIFGVVIIVLLGVLLFVPAVKGPTTLIDSSEIISSPSGNITISLPKKDGIISSPIKISGSAKGWYFEASFPIKIVDGDGSILGENIARAQSDWMTTSSVPFLATISFNIPQYAPGTIIFQKDNPSGRPESDEKFIMPIRFR